MSEGKFRFRCRASGLGKIMGARGMGKTGESFVQDWLKEKLYGTRREIYSKYIDKGNENEDIAIEMAAHTLNHPMLLKNEDWFENDWVHGTPDIILADSVIDVKCSWDAFTFPLFETELPNMDYYWQLQAYMWLTGTSSGKVVYCLTETDYEQPQYKDVPESLKIKSFNVAYDPAAIEKIKERVEQCNNYLNTINKWN